LIILEILRKVYKWRREYFFKCPRQLLVRSPLS